jgi:hypothetical protein
MPSNWPEKRDGPIVFELDEEKLVRKSDSSPLQIAVYDLQTIFNLLTSQLGTQVVMEMCLIRLRMR